MGRLRIKGKILLCLVLLTLLVSGCWGRRETDEMGYVLAMGLDKGKENIIKVTFQIAIPRALAGGGGGGGEKGTEIVSVEAASIFGALQLANAFVSKDLTFIHNEIVIISSEIAREGLDMYINPLIRSREIRRNATIAICEGSAAEFLKANQPRFEKDPAKQFELLLESENYAGIMYATTLNEFNKKVKSPGSESVLTLVGVNKDGKEEPGEEYQGDKNFSEKVRDEVAYLPGEVPREGGNQVDTIGLAVFRSDRLTGFLNGSETRYFQMLTGKFYLANMTFPDPNREDKIIVVRVKQGRNPEIKVDLKGERPKVDVRLILEGEFVSIQSSIDYEGGEKEKDLERYLETYLAAEAGKLIKRTQEELKSDIFGFGEVTRKYFWTWQDWVDYGWTERYPEAEIKVQCSMNIRRTGLMRRTAPLQ